MKIKHIYTVVREYDIDPEELKEERDFFKSAIKSEPKEYLYSGPTAKETVTVVMETEKN